MFLPRWFSLVSILLWVTASTLEVKADPGQSTSNACLEPALSRLRIHLVAFGETTDTIARKYNLIPATLLGLNPALRFSEARVGSEIVVPPYNGIRIEIPAGQTWRDVAAAYNVRPDVVFEVNGCQQNPRIVFVPGINWSPEGSDSQPQNELSNYPLPAVATVAFGYGWKLHPVTGKVAFHSGVDLLSTPGTPVLAVSDGIVAFAGEQGTYGNLVVINHRGGRQTRYAHLDRLTVKTGQSIKLGERLGTVGSTGQPDLTQPHLHFEIRYQSDLGWVAENPELYLRNMEIGNRESGMGDS